MSEKANPTQSRPSTDRSGSNSQSRSHPAPGPISFRRSGLTITEVYFDDRMRAIPPGTDLLRILAVLDPSPGENWRRSNTLIVELDQDEDALLAGMAKNTRYEIRRAGERDRLQAEVFGRPEPALVNDFAEYYDRFAAGKSLAPVFRPRLEALGASGMLVLSRVTSDSDPLVWHAYVGTGARGLLLYSASTFRESDDSSVRSLSGRANRFLHWRDMLHFKGAGYRAYDLGGIDADRRRPETARIADFKQAFGGRVHAVHARAVAQSAKGRLARAALRVRGQDF